MLCKSDRQKELHFLQKKKAKEIGWNEFESKMKFQIAVWFQFENEISIFKF